jgi:hypothetical protein
LLVAGAGKLGQAIIEGTSGRFEETIVRNRWNELEWFRNYKIWELMWLELPKKAVWIITCTANWVDAALNDFQNIPTFIASSEYPIGLVDFMMTRGSSKILEAPNLALPVAELQQIFAMQKSFEWMTMQIHESHQSGKKDPSGTALKIREIFVSKGGICEYTWAKNYKARSGISEMWDIINYRWEKASREWLYVGQWSMPSHAYHDYEIKWEWNNYDEFLERITTWEKRNQERVWSDLHLWFRNNNDEWILVYHYVDGRSIYSEWLIELLPWFLSQNEGLYSTTDYIDSKISST